MKIILLSGGSGKRLWPLSNDVRSKQFLRLLPAPDGTSESMIQRVVRQIRHSAIAESITIATAEAQLDAIRSQLAHDIDVVTEPSRRGTFPAIALASAFLKDNGCPDNEIIVVMPCDAFTEDAYFQTISKMADAIEDNAADIILMGIQPDKPETKYGYIISEVPTACGAFRVAEFVEKPPTTEQAENLLRRGAFWNGGVFAFRLKFMTDILAKYSTDTSYNALREHFDKLPATSFDCEVIEKNRDAAVIPFRGRWKDLGTWEALSEEMSEKFSGYVVNAPDVRHTHVVNELDLPIVCVGVDNLIVSASPDGILIADKRASEAVKQQVAVIHSRPMFEERRWGFYKVLGHTEYPDGHRTLTKLLHLNPGSSISYQQHAKRDEVWTFVDGEALLVIDGEITKVGRGYVANIRAGQLHAVKALTHLEIIEVQSGSELVEEDIRRFPLTWPQP